MAISCDHCDMTFKYNCFLEKHLSRKYPCFLKQQPFNSKSREMNNKDEIKVCTAKIKENTVIMKRNTEIVKESTGKRKKNHKCDKCVKTFFNKNDCLKHADKCTGCHILQCSTCLKMFSCAQSKSEHRRKVKCKPPEPPPITTHSGDVNINSHNNITNNITNNIKIVNWSNETYEHMTPEVIANIVRKCVNAEQPLTFFSEFPNIAHQGVHKNLRVTNIRGNYLDVYEDGKFLKLMVDYVMEDCAKRMIYRLEDAMGENEKVFKGLDNVSAHLIRMEDVVHGIPKREACEKQLMAMEALEVDMRSDVLRHVKNGLWNVAR